MGNHWCVIVFDVLACILNSCLQFLYINSTFSPAPDDTVQNLYKVRPNVWHIFLTS